MNLSDLVNLIHENPDKLIQFQYMNGRNPLFWIYEVDETAVYGFPINPEGTIFIEESPLFRISPEWVADAYATNISVSQITRVEIQD